MKKIVVFIIAVGIIVAIVAAAPRQAPSTPAESTDQSTVLPSEPEGEVAGAVTENDEDETVAEAESENILPAEFGLPMENALARVTKKPFGMHITPATSPVENDRFNGFHVGVDFETFTDEADAEILIYAICDGPLILKKQATGYGGVAVQSCTLNDEPVTVVYGHLALTSITPEVGQQLTRGETIGRLGQGQSEETDGVRKHLHLGVHQGDELNIRGYVQTEDEVAAWLDAQEYLLAE